MPGIIAVEIGIESLFRLFDINNEKKNGRKTHYHY